MPLALRHLAVTALILLLAGPSHAQDPGLSENAPPPSALEGPSWRLMTYRSAEGTMTAVLPNARAAYFQFQEGRLSGGTGCNRLLGTYRLDGTILTFEKGLSATQMGCPPPIMKQESAILAAIKAIATYRREDRRLDLIDAQGQPLLRFEWPQASPLMERPWRLESYHNGKQALVSPIKGSEINLTFQDRGRLGGSDGCNRYMSGFTLEGDALRIGPIATTRMACQANDGRADQASAYAAALGRVVGYRIEEDRLTLLDAAGQPTARFRAITPAEPDQPK